MNRLMPWGFSALVILALLTGCMRLGAGSPSGSPKEPAGGSATSPGPNPASVEIPPGTPFGNSADHQVGNGGAGVCLMGTCRTLAEFGLRTASPEEEFYVPTPALVQEVRKLFSRLPFGSYGDDLFKKTIGQGKTFKLLAVADPQKLEIIRERYAKLLDAEGSTIAMKVVKIFAFASEHSDSAVTYLLPDFFTLDLTSQAKILIHESNVRVLHFSDSRSTILQSVLEFDGMMEELLNDPTVLMKRTFRLDRWEDLLAMFRRGYLSASVSGSRLSSFIHWVHWLRTNLGMTILQDELCEPSIYQSGCSFDVATFNSYHNAPPAFIRVLSALRSVSALSRESSRLKQEDAMAACQTYLADRSKTRVLHPYLPEPGVYEVALLTCSQSEGKLSWKALDLEY